MVGSSWELLGLSSSNKVRILTQVVVRRTEKELWGQSCPWGSTCGDEGEWGRTVIRPGN